MTWLALLSITWRIHKCMYISLSFMFTWRRVNFIELFRIVYALLFSMYVCECVCVYFRQTQAIMYCIPNTNRFFLSSYIFFFFFDVFDGIGFVICSRVFFFSSYLFVVLATNKFVWKITTSFLMYGITTTTASGRGSSST